MFPTTSLLPRALQVDVLFVENKAPRLRDVVGLIETIISSPARVMVPVPEFEKVSFQVNCRALPETLPGPSASGAAPCPSVWAASKAMCHALPDWEMVIWKTARPFMNFLSAYSPAQFGTSPPWAPRQARSVKTATRLARRQAEKRESVLMRKL